MELEAGLVRVLSKSTAVRALSKSVRSLLRPRTPPTENEKRYIEEFRSSLNRLGQTGNAEIERSTAQWKEYCGRLRALGLQSDPREFLHWDVIRFTMSVGTEAYIVPEFDFLKHSPLWKLRWRRAIAEVPAGHPRRYLFYPRTSGDLIHQAYHVARFEQETGQRIEDAEYILEFGAGYGCMCRLLYSLGFKGKYLLFDLPPFSELQKLYLRLAGIQVASADSAKTQWTQALCLTRLEDLEAAVHEAFHGNSIFIATWSLSESPLEVRHRVAGLLDKFTGILIAHEEGFGGVDNTSYFAQFKRALDSVHWRQLPIPHMNGVVGQNHTYLFGTAAARNDPGNPGVSSERVLEHVL